MRVGVLVPVAVGAELPVYAHVPNVNGPDGKRLSKRHGAAAVEEWRDQGILPEALFNFLALLGWAPDGETTIMSREELIERSPWVVEACKRHGFRFSPRLHILLWGARGRQGLPEVDKIPATPREDGTWLFHPFPGGATYTTVNECHGGRAAVDEAGGAG